ncbi:hypothetical protein R3P38DRAFT_1120431 [Favolaschia claudopus]|uniref:GATA-type domain-containing protein n=1 Tax=Favolaschia claudopus TaxID=2862362 RepID=A0AAW0B9H1_9AGAR
MRGHSPSQDCGPIEPPDLNNVGHHCQEQDSQPASTIMDGSSWQNAQSSSVFSLHSNTVSQAFLILLNSQGCGASEETAMLIRLLLYQGWLSEHELLNLVDWQRLQKLALESAANHLPDISPAKSKLIPSFHIESDVPVDDSISKASKFPLGTSGSANVLTLSPTGLLKIPRPSFEAELSPTESNPLPASTSGNIPNSRSQTPSLHLASARSASDELNPDSPSIAPSPRFPSPIPPSAISPNITIIPASLSIPPEIPSYKDCMRRWSSQTIQRTTESLHVGRSLLGDDVFSSEAQMRSLPDRSYYTMADTSSKGCHLCNACGQYLLRQGKPRPLDTINAAKLKEMRGGEVIMRVSTKHAYARRNLKSQGEETVQLCEPELNLTELFVLSCEDAAPGLESTHMPTFTQDNIPNSWSPTLSHHSASASARPALGELHPDSQFTGPQNHRDSPLPCLCRMFPPTQPSARLHYSYLPRYHRT